MISLRRFLLITVLSTLVLVNFLAALHGYNKSMAEAQALFDRKLRAYAEQLLALTVPVQTLSPAPSGGGPLFQLLDEHQRVYWRSDNAPETAIAAMPGFSDANFGHYRWRFYSLDAEFPPRRVVVAERLDQRFELAEKVVLESVLPVLFTLPVAGLLIWLIVGYGLSPLSRLARTLRSKSTDDLVPIELISLPKELTPVVASLNSLLSRLDSAFARERRFSADAAHELRTPIAAIGMHLHNALAEPAACEASLQQMQGDVQRLSHLVEQMLDLHRMSPETYPAKFEVLNLKALCQEVISRYYSLFQNKGQSITLSGDAADIRGDRFAVEVLLQNLLKNASYYTQAGGTIEVVVSSEGNRVALCVQDNGPGIADADSERIFERFYRVGGDRHGSGESGCGLGLSIVAHIAALHGAEIQLGKGIAGSGLAAIVRFAKTSNEREVPQ